jgi:hypothetical protein
MRSRRNRTDAGLTSLQIAVIAASAALLALVVYLVATLVFGDSKGAPVTPSESPSGGASASASPTVTPGPTSWADVASEDRPPFLPGRPGEPTAREWAPWVLDLIDETWGVEIWCDPNPASNPDAPEDQTSDRCLYQALYVVAPDGERLRIYELRTDILLGIEATAMDERVVWIARYFYEAQQTVELDLATGTGDESWAHDGFSNVSAESNQDGWFVYYADTLPDGRMIWSGSDYGTPLNGVFFRDSGGLITPSSLSPNFFGDAGEPWCVGVDPDAGVAIYESYEFAEGEPVANWPARLVKHDLQTDTWTIINRLGPYGEPCHDAFEVTPTYYVGQANRADQQGLYRYYFDGSADQLVP